MPLTYGAYTACLQDRSLPEALDVLKDAGLTGAEVNVGGFIPSPHCPVDALLASPTARDEYLGLFQDRGMRLSGLNTSGNPTSPLPNEGLKHAEDIRAAIRLAGLLGVKEIVTMSGTPGTDSSAKYPTWVVNPWNGIDMEILDYQWSVVIPFFKEIDALARDNDVQVCLELHPRNLVFNVPSFERLVEETGATNIKVNMDPSHLFWQQMDPIAATRRLGPSWVTFTPRTPRSSPAPPTAGSWTPTSATCPPRPRARSRWPTATGATPGPRTQPGDSSPSGWATTPTTGPSS